MKRKLVVFLCALSLIGLTNAQEASEAPSVAAVTIDANTTEYASLDEAITEANKAGASQAVTITLLQDVQMTAGVVISGKKVTFDLDQKCLTFSSSITTNLVSFTNEAVATFKNGTINISGGKTSANAIFQVSDSAQMAFEEVKLIGENYDSAYAVLYAYNTCTGNPAIALTNCTVTLENETSGDGGFLKADNTNSKMSISDCKISLKNPVRGIIKGDVTIENSSLTITGERTSTTLDNGINFSNLTVKHSTIAISNGSGRGLTLDESNTVSIDANSTVTISQMGEGAVKFKSTITSDAKLTVEGTLKMDKAIVNESTTIATDTVVSGSDKIVNTSLVAQIGETIYPSLADAIAAAQSGDTITLLQDVTESGLTLADKQITLALDGHTIPAGSIVISGSGEVTVTGGTGSIPVSVDTTKGALLTIVEAEGNQTYCTDKLYYNNGELFAQGHAVTIEGQDGTDSDTNLRLTYTEGGKSYTTLYTSTTAVRLFAGWKYPTVDTKDHAYTLTMKSGKVQSLRGSNKDKTGGSIASSTIVMEGGTAEIIASAWYYCPSVGVFTVKISGGKVGKVYGNGETASTASSTITTYKDPTVTEVKIEISGGTVDFVYGGGRAQTTANTSANYAMRTVKATIDISGGTVTCVNGGGFNGPEANWGEDSGQDQVIVEEAEITVRGGTVANVFGGGYNGQWKWTYKYHETNGLVFSNYNGEKTTTVRNTVTKSTVNVQEGAAITNLYLGGRSYAYVAETVANITGGTVGTLSMSGNYGYIAKSTATVSGGTIQKAELLTRNYAGNVSLAITGGTVGELYAGVGGAYKNSNSTEKETYNVCTLAVLGSATISAAEGTVTAAYLTTGLEKATAVACELPLTVKTMNLVDDSATGDSAYTGTLTTSGAFAIEAPTANWQAEIAFASADESFKPLADTTGSLTYTSLVEGMVVGIGEDGLTRSLIAPPPVAQIGETTYASLEEAIAAAQPGDTVTLLQDVALADKKSVLVVGKGTPEAPLTLDFNGHFMKGNNSSTASTASASSASSGILAVAQSHVVLTDSSTGAKGGVRNTYTKSGTTTSYYAAVLVTTAYKDGTTTYADASAVIQGGIHLEVPDAGITGCAVRQYHSETKGGTNKVEIIDAETQISGVVVCKTEGAGATCEIKGGRFTSTCASARTVAKDTHHTDENEIVYDIKVSGGEFTNHYVPQSDFPILSGDVVMDLAEGGQLHWTVGQPVPDAVTMTVETLPSGYKSAEGVQIAVQGNAPFACLDAFNLFRSGVGVRINETVEESCASLSFGNKTQMQALEITVAQGKTLTFTEALPLYRATITVKGEGTFSAESLKPQTEAYELTTPAAAEGTTLYVCDVTDDALVATWTKADGSVNKYASVDDFVSFGTNAESTFKLYQDVEISLGVTTSSKWNVSSGRKLTLDLNGHTLSLLSSSKGYHYILLNKGTLAITNSDTTRLGTLVSANTETAAIVVKGSTSATATDYSVLSIGEKVLVKGTSAVLIDRYSSSSAKNYGTKVSIAGALEGIDDAAGNPGSALYLNGTLEATTDAIPEVALTSTAQLSSSGVGIYAAGYGKWSVADGAQISGALSGIEIRAGELTVNGGTIKSLAESYSVEPNGSGTTTVGAGIAVAQHGTELPLKVTVKGGEISGYVALSEANPQGNKAEAIEQVSLNIQGGTFKAQSAAVVSADCTGFISGGYFSNAVPLAYCATGKVPKTLKAEETGYMAEAPYTVTTPKSANFVAVNADGSAEVYKTLEALLTKENVGTKVYIAPSAETNEAVAAALSAKATTGPTKNPQATTLTVKEAAEVLGGAFTVSKVTNQETQATETKLVYHYNFGVAGLEVKRATTDELALTVVAKLTEGEGESLANRTLVGRTLQVVLTKGDGTEATYDVANPVFDAEGQCRVPVPWSAMKTGTNSIKVKVVK